MKTIFDFGWGITKSNRGHDILENLKHNRTIFFNRDKVILKVDFKQTRQIVELGFKIEEIIALGEYLKTLDTDVK